VEWEPDEQATANAMADPASEEATMRLIFRDT
jgi:hypothetical protein